jgi:Xaa-Pro dipeptidase
MASKADPMKVLRHQEVPGFTRAEFEHRVERARRLMTEHRLDGLMLTSEANIEYLAGFMSQFPWTSPSRPWYFVLPRAGDAVAIIPAVGLVSWRETSWCKNIRTWVSPYPENEGLDLLAGEIGRIKRRFGRFGTELGPESRLGMPVADLLHVRDAIRPIEMVDCVSIMRTLRLVKTPAEIAHIWRICQVASDTFDRLPSLVHVGDSEKEICRAFASELHQHGADTVPYTSIGTGKGGYTSIITGPSDRRLERGDPSSSIRGRNTLATIATSIAMSPSASRPMRLSVSTKCSGAPLKPALRRVCPARLPRTSSMPRPRHSRMRASCSEELDVSATGSANS